VTGVPQAAINMEATIRIANNLNRFFNIFSSVNRFELIKRVKGETFQLSTLITSNQSLFLEIISKRRTKLFLTLLAMSLPKKSGALAV
jgi:hypothetical protein